jgi:hypothetical protein
MPIRLIFPLALFILALLLGAGAGDEPVVETRLAAGDPTLITATVDQPQLPADQPLADER